MILSRIRRALGLIGLSALIAVATPAAAARAEVPESAAPASNQNTGRQIMVMLDLKAEHYRAGSNYSGNYGDPMAQQMRLRVARRIAREHHLKLLENWPMEMVGVDCVIMAIMDDRTAEKVASELTGLPGVAWSQPLNEFQMQGDAAVASPIHYNDRLLRAQPSVSDWHLASLHRVATGRGVTIAIIDSRIDTAHPDLVGQVTTASDFVTGRPLAERHGTGVAGIIAARPGNAMGIAGVAPGARVMGLRACWERSAGGATVCNSLTLAKALTYALEHNVDVINLSLAGPPDRLLTTLIQIAVSRGVTVVVAVDENRPEGSYPASVAGVIPVGDERLSARGLGVYIAPGRDVPTTEPEGQWNLVSGSSYAAAHVSGLAALLRQLSAQRNLHGTAASMLGPRGRIDACAAIARLSRLDQAGCDLTH